MALVGGPTAVSRVEAELWREANADEGGGFLGTAVTTDDGEVVYADRMKLMAWRVPSPRPTAQFFLGAVAALFLTYSCRKTAHL